MITKSDISNLQEKAKGIRAVVIGDTMLDKYIYGVVERISPEAPVPILTHQSLVIKAGGAANVALNLAAWGCETTIIGLTGHDENENLLKGILDKHSIRHELLSMDDRPTTVKTRIVAASHHLLRIDEESSDYLSADTEQYIIDRVKESLERIDADLFIIQDYNKGFLTKALITEIIRIARKKKVFLAVDPKEKHFFDFRGADLLKPNLREASVAANRNLQLAELSGIARDWRDKMNLGTIAITLGSNGVFIQDQRNEEMIQPERAIDVIDVCGAGDAVVCSLALALIYGMSLDKAGALANLTGAYVCSHSGVVSADPQEIMQWV